MACLLLVGATDALFFNFFSACGRSRGFVGAAGAGFSFRGVTKRWAIILWGFVIFLIFPDFLGFYVVRTLVR